LVLLLLLLLLLLLRMRGAGVCFSAECVLHHVARSSTLFETVLRERTLASLPLQHSIA